MDAETERRGRVVLGLMRMLDPAGGDDYGAYDALAEADRALLSRLYDGVVADWEALGAPDEGEEDVAALGAATWAGEVPDAGG